jgi:hypothetical protein
MCSIWSKAPSLSRPTTNAGLGRRGQDDQALGKRSICASLRSKLWDVISGVEAMTLKSNAGSVWSVPFRPDITTFFAGTACGPVVVWCTDRET